MRDVDVFQLALGVETPWRVERSEFDAEGKRLDLYIDFHPGGPFAYPERSGRGCVAHDTSNKTWRHLSFFQHETYLHVQISIMVRAVLKGSSFTHPRQIRDAIDDCIEVYNPEGAPFEWRRDSVHQVHLKKRHAEIRK